MVFETEGLHVCWREKVATVQDQRAGHCVANALPVENAKFIPFGEKEEGVSSDSSLVGIATRNELGIGAACVREGLRIVGRNASASGYQAFVKLDGWRTTNVIRTSFVGKAQERDLFVFQDPEGTLYFLEKSFDAGGVCIFGCLKDPGIHALRFDELAKCPEVLGQAVTAKANTGLEEG